MSDLLTARAASHEARRQSVQTVYIGNDGASYDPPPPPPSFKYQLSRALVGGVRDAGQGVIDLASEFGDYFNENVANLGYLTYGPDGIGYSMEKPVDGQNFSLSEVSAPDAGLAENVLRGLTQFATGAAAAPIKGAGLAAQMGRGAFSDALFDPEDGNLSTMLKSFGLEGAFLDFMDSKVEEDAGAEERLKARMTQSLEGAGLGALVDGAMAGFRAIRSDEGLVETVKQSLSETGTKAKAAFDAIPVPDGATMYSNPIVAAVDAAKAAYEAAPNDPQLRIDYFDLRKQRDADPIAQAQPPTDAEPGIIAFHGSAADFDQFRLEKIGTGEGVQAYGYGLYFADKEAIADFYRGALTDVPFDYKIDGQSVSKMYRDAAYADNHELADVLEQVQLHDTPKTLKAKFTVENGYTQETADFVADLDYTKLTGVDVDGKEIPLGRIYKVGLTPKPDDLLDYDKPLGGQTQAIQEMVIATLKANGAYPGSNAAALKMQGANVLEALSSNMGAMDWPVGANAKTRQELRTKGEANASQALFEAGIPGIKFADNDSRSQQFVLKLDVRGKPYETEPIYARNLDDAKRIEANYKEKGFGVQIDDNRALNYVIFDDSMIKILEKYGIVGPVAISAAAASKGGQKDDET